MIVDSKYWAISRAVKKKRKKFDEKTKNKKWNEKEKWKTNYYDDIWLDRYEILRFLFKKCIGFYLQAHAQMCDVTAESTSTASELSYFLF